MNIHQLCVNYHSYQDRILVRINTTSGEEFRVWVTRRMAVNIVTQAKAIVAQWVVAQEAVKSPYIASGADAQTQQMLAQFKREESLQKSDFQTPYKRPATSTQSPQPLLLTELNMTPLSSGHLELLFQEKLPADEDNPSPVQRSFRVAMEQSLVHGFLHLFEVAFKESEWSQLAPTTPPLASDFDELAANPTKRPQYLN